jgi:hypothetical protein
MRNNFCSSPDVIEVIKSRMTRWALLVARMRADKCIRNFSREA